MVERSNFGRVMHICGKLIKKDIYDLKTTLPYISVYMCICISYIYITYIYVYAMYVLYVVYIQYKY